MSDKVIRSARHKIDSFIFKGVKIFVYNIIVLFKRLYYLGISVISPSQPMTLPLLSAFNKIPFFGIPVHLNFNDKSFEALAIMTPWIVLVARHRVQAAEISLTLKSNFNIEFEQLI